MPVPAKTFCASKPQTDPKNSCVTDGLASTFHVPFVRCRMAPNPTAQTSVDELPQTEVRMVLGEGIVCELQVPLPVEWTTLPVFAPLPPTAKTSPAPLPQTLTSALPMPLVCGVQVPLPVECR